MTLVDPGFQKVPRPLPPGKSPGALPPHAVSSPAPRTQCHAKEKVPKKNRSDIERRDADNQLAWLSENACRNCRGDK